jgi:hypothetical protein
MKIRYIECIERCTDPSTKKVTKAQLIGVKEKKFVYWCKTCCKQFEVPV